MQSGDFFAHMMAVIYDDKQKDAAKKADLKKETEKVEEKKEVKIAPPWIQYVNKLVALFGKDPEIHLDYKNDEHTVTMRVDNHEKAEALIKLLPAAKEFGNVTLNINIVPCNNLDSKEDLYLAAFNGNPAFAFTRSVEGVFTNPITYVVFSREVVQYYNDDLGDLFGNCTTLYQDIAKDLFGGEEGVFFCTNNK